MSSSGNGHERTAPRGRGKRFDARGPTLRLNRDGFHPSLAGNTEPFGAESLAVARSEPALGSRIGHYELIRKLGQGGMGTVFLARDVHLGRLAALKFLAEQRSELVARFVAEARATARCRHENIVVIYDQGETGGHPYMALEYLEGQTLRQWMNERGQENDPAAPKTSAPVAISRAVELMVPVARALVAAHAMGIIHRDLKPANIMLTDSGTVKVLDFGIAKVLSTAEVGALPGLPRPGARPLSMTATGAVLGTYPYMSPEQLRGETVDHRSDLWAMGIMLYELAVGQHPLAPISYDALERAANQRDTPMPSATEQGSRLERLGPIIDRCLIKSRDDRTSSAAELLAELEALVPNRRVLVIGGDENPFTGLAAFQESDADRFFGRAQEIASTVTRLREQPLVAVVGPSGAGKSSFVRAGVIPALERSGEGWDAFSVRPGRHPLAALAGVLTRIHHSIGRQTGDPGDDGDERNGMVVRLAKEPGYLGAQLRLRANKRLRRTVLFIDQFEELYTMGAVAAERAAFLACLAGVADDPASPLRVVISLRSDFLDSIAETRELMAQVAQGLVFLGPMGRDGLREALTRPLEATETRFESEDMVEGILDAVEGTPGALPLLQFAAAKLWDARDRSRRLVTQDSFEAIGGIAGALSGHADAVLAAMSSRQRAAARLVLERLVTPERTRAIASMSELRQLPGDPDDIERVTRRLADARLLVIETGAHAEGSAVELVHESLIASWPTLTRWLDEHQEDTAFLTRLRTAAKQWNDKKRPKGMLWREEAAHEARLWHARHQGELPRLEREYITAVFALADRSARRRRRLIASTGSFLLIIALAMGYLAWQEASANQRAHQAAEKAQSEAERARREAARANREAQVAQAVSTFLVDLFKSSDPSKTLGENVTARQILDQGAERVARELRQQPEIQATLEHTIGEVYWGLGLYDRAEGLLRTALQTRRHAQSPNQVAIAETLEALGEVLINKSAVTEAEALLREALGLRRQALGAKHITVAANLSKLAGVPFARGEYAAAETLYQEALAIHRDAADPDREAIAALLHGLALTAANQGNADAAQTLFAQALAAFEDALGAEHPRVAHTIHNNAFWLHRHGELAEAEIRYRQALALYRKLLGDDHPITGSSLTNLADLHNANGNHVEAEKLAREAMAIVAAKLPAESWRIAAAKSVLGASLSGLGRYREAEPLLLESQAVIEANTGTSSIYTVSGLERIVALYDAWPAPDKAARYRARIAEANAASGPQ